MANLKSLTPKEQFLIQNAEAAFQRGGELLSWWKAKVSSGFASSFTHNPPQGLSCFYDTLPLDAKLVTVAPAPTVLPAPPVPAPWPKLTAQAGALIPVGKQATVQGCTWRSRYPRNAQLPQKADSSLQSFIQKQFLERCHWTHPDGLPGGFTFIPHYYKLEGEDEYIVAEGPPPDLSEIGQRYQWMIMEAVVNDFFRYAPGPHSSWWLKKMPKMSSYVLVHKDYFSSFHPPIEGAISECCFGYSFLPCPVAPSIFGYGPGEFAAALKQFRFVLLENSDVEIQMFFLVSPRSQKILSLMGGFDPVYSSVNLANALTLNLFNIKQRAHNALDAIQLGLHAVIYQGLLDGLKTTWEDRDWAGVSQSTR